MEEVDEVFTHATRISLLVTLFLLSGLREQVVSGQQKKHPEFEGDVEFQAIDPSSGAAVPFSLVSLRDDRGRDVLKNCSGTTCRDLVIGAYRYTVRRTRDSFEQSDAKILGKPKMLVTITFAEAVPGMFMIGRVRGAEGRQAVWMRAQSVFSSYHLDARVAEDGHFEWHGLLAGTYHVSLLSGTQMLGYTTFQCCSRRTVSFRPFRDEFGEPVKLKMEIERSGSTGGDRF